MAPTRIGQPDVIAGMAIAAIALALCVRTVLAWWERRAMPAAGHR